MREIKFRQWDSRRKRMHTGIGASSGTWSGFPYCSWDVYPITQFTGLKDKNGKEIYEGDILTDRAEVKWNQDDCSFIVEFPGIETQPLDSSVCEWGEVIGNIYENPELMRGEYAKS